MNKILICGAGPVGLTLAIQCARYGVEFILIEKEKEKPLYSKALAIWSGVQETFEAIGVDISGSAVALEYMQIILEGVPQKVIHLRQELPSKYKVPLILPQYDTEAHLKKRLLELGGSIQEGVELLSFEELPDKILAKVLDNGVEKILETSWLAGCDGAHSVVRHGASISFNGYKEPDNFALCDCEISGPFPANSLIMALGKTSVAAFFPLPGSLWRIVLKSEVIGEAPSLDFFQRIFDKEGYGIKLKNPRWLSYFSVHERIADTFAKGRIFLLGDAAHVHSPAGGQGMNTGIQDAYNLGWKFPYIDRAPGNVGSSYNIERSLIARKVIREASLKEHIIMNHSPWLKWVKRIAVPVATHCSFLHAKLSYSLSGLGLCYPLSPLILKGGGRFDGSPSIKHCLYITATDLPPLPPDVLVLPGSKERWVLVRPDRFIAAEGRIGEYGLLKAYFQNLLT